VSHWRGELLGAGDTGTYLKLLAMAGVGIGVGWETSRRLKVESKSVVVL